MSEPGIEDKTEPATEAYRDMPIKVCLFCANIVDGHLRKLLADVNGWQVKTEDTVCPDCKKKLQEAANKYR